MSRPFPPEILDLIVDHLHDEPVALKTCCAVSKSWVPRSRMYLFASVALDVHSGPTVESWMETFPDPLNSPAHYTSTLRILGIWPPEAASPWLRAFRNVVRLKIEDQFSLAPFCGLWPLLRSLHLESIPIPPCEIFGFVCSFPLLEDLALLDIQSKSIPPYEWNTPSTSPKLTGSLKLRVIRGVWATTRRLLDFPNGLHFTKIVLECDRDLDFKSTTDLVLECSDTLEHLDVTYRLSGLFPSHLFLADTLLPRLDPTTISLDLSTATKLNALVFRCTWQNVQWITMALRTVESKDLQQIVLRPRVTTFANTVPELIHREWQDLDRMLLQFWFSHSIRPKVARGMEVLGASLRDCKLGLMPELSARGLIDLVGDIPQSGPAEHGTTVSEKGTYIT